MIIAGGDVLNSRTRPVSGRPPDVHVASLPPIILENIMQIWHLFQTNTSL